MRKSAVFIANTVYQMIVILQMKLSILKDIDVDLFITDHSVGVQSYAESGKETHLFNKIKYIETLDFSNRRGEYAENDFLGELLFSAKRFYEAKKRIGEIKSYDYFFSANIDLFASAFYDTLKLKNKNLKLYVFEDGLSTYKAFEKYIQDRKDEIYTGKFSRIYKLTGYGKAFSEIKGVFLFHPDIFSWKEKIKLHKIPPINKDDKNTIDKFNIFFKYTPISNTMKGKKVVFFEESYYGDGCKVNDEKMINIIADAVGKENIIIKLHPRTRKNRFADFDIFEDSNIPWEVIYLNNDFSNTELVSISSGCIIHPFTLFNEKKEVVVLLDIIKGNFSAIHKVYLRFLRESIFIPHPEIFRLVGDEDELHQYFLDRK